MKIVFMGTPDFSIFSLEKLKRSDNEILCAYTGPDRRSGRGKNRTSSNLKQYCLNVLYSFFKFNTRGIDFKKY